MIEQIKEKLSKRPNLDWEQEGNSIRIFFKIWI